MTSRARALRALSAVLPGALLLLGCITNPVTGRSELSLMSAQQEVELGRQGAADVERTIGLVRDPVVASYVEELGQRLARLSPRRDVAYHFAVADMAEPNAFALPGGWIYISRGLLAISNSEAELAGVIGHEIGHVAARHAAQRQTRQVGAQSGVLLGAVLGAALGGQGGSQAGASVAQTAGAGWVASYGRDQERQADDVGQRIAAGAGYDPGGITDFLATLERDSRLRNDGQARRAGFLDSHPLTTERVEATRLRAGGLEPAPAQPIAGSREAFLQRIQGIAVGPDPRAGVIDGSRFLHTGLDLALQFPDGWRIDNGAEAVVARSPDGSAMFALELQAGDREPERAAERWQAETGLRFERAGAVRLAGRNAFRGVAPTADGRAVLDVVWMIHRDSMLRLTGVAAPGRYEQLAGTFAASAGSVRRLEERERDVLVPLELRAARARAGETLAALGRRSGNQWSDAETAVANALDPGVVFSGGELVKVAVRVGRR